LLALHSWVQQLFARGKDLEFHIILSLKTACCFGIENDYTSGNVDIIDLGGDGGHTER
jgi:hypothetical protein